MTYRVNIQWKNCLKIRQLFLVATILLASTSYAQVKRLPANFIPNDEVFSIPLEHELWIDRYMVDDDKGILSTMQRKFAKWNRADEFAQLWDADEELIEDYSSQSTQKKYFMNQILKYVDRRISGEIKHAEKGSTMDKVGRAQKALKPQTNVRISKNIEIKFKIRLLRGRAYMNVRNPYLKSEMVMSLSGKVDVHLRKRFKEIDLEARADYKLHEEKFELGVTKGFDRVGVSTDLKYNAKSGRVIASVSKGIIPNVTAVVSSSQRMSDFRRDSVQVAKLLYALSF